MKPHDPNRRGEDNTDDFITNEERASNGHDALKGHSGVIGGGVDNCTDCITDILHYLHSNGVGEDGMREVFDRALHHWKAESGQSRDEQLRKFRPEVLTNPNYECDEPIEPEDG